MSMEMRLSGQSNNGEEEAGCTSECPVSVPVLSVTLQRLHEIEL